VGHSEIDNLVDGDDGSVDNLDFIEEILLPVLAFIVRRIVYVFLYFISAIFGGVN